MERKLLFKKKKIYAISNQLKKLPAIGLNIENPSEKLETQLIIYGNIVME